MLRAFTNFVYSVLNTVLNSIGFYSLPAPDWIWTPNSDPSAPDTNNDIDELFRDHMLKQGIKAGQFSLFVNGSLKMSSAYTWAEPGYQETKIDSVFRIASCSKAFTTAAILSLMNSGALIGDEFVWDLLSGDFPGNPEPQDWRMKTITVKHLVEHTGGWDYRSNPVRSSGDWVFHLKVIGRQMGLDDPPTKLQFAQFVLCNIDLDFAPGNRLNEFFIIDTGQPNSIMDTYSNIGYVLLGLVIEKVSGMKYIDYLNNNILQPSINDVLVGATRLDGKLSHEVLYEDPFFGPDATLGPNDQTPALSPYGGDGSMKEVMDSGGGLIMSANSLARFIGMNNVGLGTLTTDGTRTPIDMNRRVNTRRDGSMPGTRAVASCFLGKGFQTYDVAVIFNQMDKGYKDFGNTDNIDRLMAKLRRKILEVF